MSIRGRSILGAIAFFGGLLLVAYGGVAKSTDRIRYERARDLQARGGRVPAEDLEPPRKTVHHLVMAVGGLLCLGGLAAIGGAARAMADEIASSSASAEARLQRELDEKRDPKPKPPT